MYLESLHVLKYRCNFNSRNTVKPCGLITSVCWLFYSCLTLKVLNFWKFTSYCNLKPLWLGMGEVVPARTSPTLHPPSPPTVHQLSRLALLRVNTMVTMQWQLYLFRQHWGEIFMKLSVNKCRKINFCNVCVFLIFKLTLQWKMIYELVH